MAFGPARDRHPSCSIVGITRPRVQSGQRECSGPGFDSIVSAGISYNAESGGNWMGIDYVQLNPAAVPPLQFLTPVLSNGKLTLDWTGTGQLEWAPTLLGPWTPITPAPGKPYAEAIVTAQNRFYRLKKP